MKRFALLSLVALAAASAVEGCSAPDVDIARNASAGKAGQQSAGTNQQSAGTTSVNQTGGTGSAGGNSSTAGKTASGAGQSAIDSAAGAGGEIVEVGGAAASGPGGAGGETNGTCNGTAPPCFGNNTADCCGNDPAGQAVCQAGKWMCFGAAAPGCSGDRCIDLFACGPTLKCNQTKQYCRALVGGVGGDQYQCDAFPAECAQAHSCGCIALAACQSCSPGAAGGIVQSCQVG